MYPLYPKLKKVLVSEENMKILKDAIKSLIVIDNIECNDIQMMQSLQSQIQKTMELNPDAFTNLFTETILVELNKFICMSTINDLKTIQTEEIKSIDHSYFS